MTVPLVAVTLRVVDSSFAAVLRTVRLSPTVSAADWVTVLTNSANVSWARPEVLAVNVPELTSVWPEVSAVVPATVVWMELAVVIIASAVTPHAAADVMDTDPALTVSAPATVAVAVPVCVMPRFVPLVVKSVLCTSIVLLRTLKTPMFAVDVAAVAVTSSAESTRLPVTSMSALPALTSRVFDVATRSVVVIVKLVKASTVIVAASTTVPAVEFSSVLSDRAEILVALRSEMESTASSSMSCCESTRTS